jgi:hypothetical protein
MHISSGLIIHVTVGVRILATALGCPPPGVIASSSPLLPRIERSRKDAGKPLGQ